MFFLQIFSKVFTPGLEGPPLAVQADVDELLVPDQGPQVPRHRVPVVVPGHPQQLTHSDQDVLTPHTQDPHYQEIFTQDSSCHRAELLLKYPALLGREDQKSTRNTTTPLLLCI